MLPSAMTLHLHLYKKGEGLGSLMSFKMAAIVDFAENPYTCISK